MTNHTAQSLGKYIGMKLYYEATIMGNTEGYIGKLIEVSLSGIVCLNTIADEFSIDDYPVVPILKTVEDLTDEEKREIYSFMGCFFTLNDEMDSFLDEDFTDKTQRFPQLSIKNGKDLLNISAGAIPDKSSPTGYISIHDNLPCKAWSEVFK
tara:strand:- start:526 stop:981 length:456 start_codon:yes stop_codon:yes gene_type:complete